jgi:hypothetical protein
LITDQNRSPIILKFVTRCPRTLMIAIRSFPTSGKHRFQHGSTVFVQLRETGNSRLAGAFSRGLQVGRQYEGNLTDHGENRKRRVKSPIVHLDCHQA